MFAYIGYLTQILILSMIIQHYQVYLYFTTIAFQNPNRATFVSVESEAQGMSDKQIVYVCRPHCLFDPKTDKDLL